MAIARRRLFPLVFILLPLSLLLALAVPAPVQANVGPQPILPGGSSLQPGEGTPIQMVAEVVTMNIRQATAADNTLVKLAPQTYALQYDTVWYPGIAEVQAQFRMHNPTGAALSLKVWFPLASALETVSWRLERPGEIVPSLVDFQVAVDGAPVAHALSQLPNPQGAALQPLPWASFPVTFPARADTLIQVSYLLPLQPGVVGNEMIVYYIFQTGAGWAGSIAQAELVLNLPYPASPGTLADIPPGSLVLPPLNISDRPASLPANLVLNGNQARWTMQDFEPGPEDDFSLYLLRIDKWNELQSRRAAVQADPQDGQAWLDLASLYYSLSYGYNLTPLLFRATYIPPAVQAFQKAAELLPAHPLPHAGLAILTLAPYLQDKNAPAQALQTFHQEYQLANDLAAQNPSLAQKSDLLHDLEVALERYNTNPATVTLEAATRIVQGATETVLATLVYETRLAGEHAKATHLACWVASGALCTATWTSTATRVATLTLTPAPTQRLPSAAPATRLLPAVTPAAPLQAQPAPAPSAWLVTGLALGVLTLAGAVWLILRRYRRRRG